MTLDLISHITVLHKAGVDPSQYFQGTVNDKKLAAKLRNKYRVEKDTRAYLIKIINDHAVRIAENLMTNKIVRM